MIAATAKTRTKTRATPGGGIQFFMGRYVSSGRHQSLLQDSDLHNLALDRAYAFGSGGNFGGFK
jgi:hypothetical protein